MTSIFIPHLNDTVYLGETVSLRYRNMERSTLYRHRKVVAFDTCDAPQVGCKCTAHCALTLEGGGSPCMNLRLVKIIHHDIGQVQINKITEI